MQGSGVRVQDPELERCAPRLRDPPRLRVKTVAQRVPPLAEESTAFGVAERVQERRDSNGCGGLGGCGSRSGRSCYRIGSRFWRTARSDFWGRRERLDAA